MDYRDLYRSFTRRICKRIEVIFLYTSSMHLLAEGGGEGCSSLAIAASSSCRTSLRERHDPPSAAINRPRFTLPPSVPPPDTFTRTLFTRFTYATCRHVSLRTILRLGVHLKKPRSPSSARPIVILVIPCEFSVFRVE